ncbi:MAG: phospholipase [Planctomycetes bacterium]|nr:phospholipase [Planctomycetota bacterium]
MAVTTAVLRELHRIHVQLSDLRDRLARGPRQVQVHTNNVAQQQSTLKAAQLSVKQTKMAADKKQLDLKTSENKIDDLKAKLNGCSSNKEYQMFLEQIAATEMTNSVLSDEILEAMEKTDQLEVVVNEAKTNVEAATAELAKCQKKVTAEAVVIRTDIERLEGELTAAEKELPIELKNDYQRIIRSKGSEGMSEVEGQVCLGCGKQITLNMLNELLLSKPTFCKSCGCLLYMSES